MADRARNETPATVVRSVDGDDTERLTPTPGKHRVDDPEVSGRRSTVKSTGAAGTSSSIRRPRRTGWWLVDRPTGRHRLLGLSSTRRAAVFALVVCAVVLSVAVPLRNYLAQRGALHDTVQQQEKLREQVDSLERRKVELSDPAQVEVEARERLRYVRPGETPYVVPAPSPTTSRPPDVPRAAPADQRPGELRFSVHMAGGVL